MVPRSIYLFTCLKFDAGKGKGLFPKRNLIVYHVLDYFHLRTWIVKARTLNMVATLSDTVVNDIEYAICF